MQELIKVLMENPQAALVISALIFVICFLIYRLLRKDISVLSKDVELKFNLIQKDQAHIKELLGNHITDTNKKIDDVKITLDKRINEVEDRLGTGLKEVKVTLDKRINEVEDRLGTGLKEVKVTLDKRINEVEDHLGTGLKEVKVTLDKRIDKLETGLKEVKVTFDKRVDKLETGLKEVKVTLDKKVDKLESKMDIILENMKK